MRVTAHPRAARTPTASVKNGIVILAALVLAHDPAQAQQLDQERGTVRACEQAGAALGCATWPEIGASFHLGLHYSDINRLPRRYTQVMPHKMLF